MTNDELMQENLQKISESDMQNVCSRLTQNCVMWGAVCGNSGNIEDSISDIVNKIESLTQSDRDYLNQNYNFIFRQIA